MTIGEERVRTTFNPSNDTLVDSLKQATARLIDECEKMKGSAISDEQVRLAALAQTSYEEACMWAVKAATTTI